MKTNRLAFALVTATIFLFNVSSFAQSINFSDMEGAAQQGSDTLINIVGWILWAIVAAGVVSSVYFIAFESQKTRQAIVSLVVSLIVVATGFALGIL